MSLADKFKLRIANKDNVSAADLIMLQSYMDGIFRLIIFIYSLALAVLAFTHKYIFIFVVLFLIIVFCIVYAFFTLVTVGSILLEFEDYNKFNLAFYYIETILLTLLFGGILWYIIRPIRGIKERKSKRYSRAANI